MRKKIDWQWEPLDYRTDRAKVIGGWIIKHWNEANGAKEWALSESMVFISDPDHNWTIPKPVQAPEIMPKDKALEF